MAREETLHEALAGLGITSAKDERSDFNTRSLYRNGEWLGHYEAHAAWKLVHELRPRGPSSLAETFAA